MLFLINFKQTKMATTIIQTSSSSSVILYEIYVWSPLYMIIPSLLLIILQIFINENASNTIHLHNMIHKPNVQS